MDPIRLLAIGNSLAENPIEFLRQVTHAVAHRQVEVGFATIGGCSLQKHSNLAALTEIHPTHKTYLFDKGGAAGMWIEGDPVNLQEALQRREWDFVTINQGSVPGPYRHTWTPWIEHLVSLVRSLAPSARVMLNMTWAYRDDSPWLIERGWTSETMFKRLKENYLHFGSELACEIIPTGEAIQNFRRSFATGFAFPDPEFDYSAGSYPALPKQENSLSVGWHWNVNDTPDGIPQLVLDPNHLNTAGKYLAACTWVGMLTGANVREVVWRPECVDSALASTLRECAEKECLRYRSYNHDFVANLH
jgi:hypothetical protein